MVTWLAIAPFIMHYTYIDPSHKYHKALDKYPTMHQICTCVQISVTKLCIVGYATGALWDLYNMSIATESGIDRLPQSVKQISLMMPWNLCEIFILKSVLVNNNVQLWHLIGWLHNHQPITNHARKTLSTDMVCYTMVQYGTVWYGRSSWQSIYMDDIMLSQKDSGSDLLVGCRALLISVMYRRKWRWQS